MFLSSLGLRLNIYSDIAYYQWASRTATSWVLRGLRCESWSNRPHARRFLRDIQFRANGPLSIKAWATHNYVSGFLRELESSIRLLMFKLHRFDSNGFHTALESGLLVHIPCGVLHIPLLSCVDPTATQLNIDQGSG